MTPFIPKWLSIAICFCLLFCFPSYSQNQPAVTGVVSDEKSAPLIGVTVTMENTNTKVRQATQTDANGAFTFANVAPGGPFTFVFTYVGYAEKTLTVNQH